MQVVKDVRFLSSNRKVQGIIIFIASGMMVLGI